MVRVLMVWFQFKFIWAACTVLFFADGVALLAVMFAPMPILHLMGGVRLAPTEAILAATAGSVFCFGGCTLPFWFVGWATAHAEFAAFNAAVALGCTLGGALADRFASHAAGAALAAFGRRDTQGWTDC
jgi:hypothetical protein